jgi:hypothetical protein
MTKLKPQTDTIDQETAATRETVAEQAPKPVAQQRDEEPLPDWTKRYPPEYRRCLAWAGMDPDDYPRGHELNLRIVEVGQAFKKAAPGVPIDVSPRIFDQSSFSCAVNETYLRVRVRRWRRDTFEGMLEDLDGRAPLPARSVEDVEVQPGWMSIYATEYAGLLAAQGVPTVAGSLVDDYNRRLIELVAPDCTDEAELRRAAWDALKHVFGGSWDRALDAELGPDFEGPFWDDEPEPLEELCWSFYPPEHQQLLAMLGRPDYEHPNAAHYNRALVAVELSMREDGPVDQAALMTFRRRLWAAFFDDAPCPD